ncbi:MAG: RNA polymerase sigma factor [bacterium]
MLSDQELMVKFREQADEPSLKELVKRYARKMYWFCFSMIRNREDAEEMVQECYIRIIHSRAFYRENQAFAPWLFTILRNLCIDFIRKKRKQPLKDEFMSEEHNQDPYHELETKQLYQAVLDAMEDLPQDDCQALLLRIQGGLRYAEISKIYNISEEAVKKRIYRGIKQLRDKLSRFL